MLAVNNSVSADKLLRANIQERRIETKDDKRQDETTKLSEP